MTKRLVDSELLERLHNILNCGAADEDIIVDAADELRAALDAPQQEAVATYIGYTKGVGHAMTLHSEKIPAGTKLYTHPAPSVQEEQNVSDAELPGMWEYADFSGGSTDFVAQKASTVSECRQLLEECRLSVKFDLNRYERMVFDFKRLGAEGKRMYDMADTEAIRLHTLLEKIDAMLSAVPKPPTTDDRKDAERYRFVRSRTCVSFNPYARQCLLVLLGIAEVSYDAAKTHGFDAAIDAAIAVQKGEKE